MADEMQTVQRCLATRRTARIMVPSRSAPDQEYAVEVVLLRGSVSCTCPGFRFRGTCDHTNFAVDPCGWCEGDAPRQSADQRERRICPRCGGMTVDALPGGHP